MPKGRGFLGVLSVSRLGLNIRGTIAHVARDRGTTMTQARADLLAAYHRHHDGGPTHD